MIEEQAEQLTEKIVEALGAEVNPRSLGYKEALRPDDDLSKGGVKMDAGKADYSLIPPEGPRGVATVLAYGARKYAPRNWEQGMAWSRPYSAIHRHLSAWWEGEDRDPDTGYSHLWHVATNVFFLIAYEARNKGKDDRPR